MDPSGQHGQHGAQFARPSHPQVRVEIPQYVSAENMRAHQKNDVKKQSNQAPRTEKPQAHQTFHQGVPLLPKSHPSVKGHGDPRLSTNACPATNETMSSMSDDDPLLFLSLAEEYFGAAFGAAVPGAIAERESNPERFCTLVSAGLTCLEGILQKGRLQPVPEAAVRLCYASIVFEETENVMEAEECLSRGISHCEQYRLLDMKYNMQHLLVRITFAAKPKAAFKFLDNVIRDEAEAQQHLPWVYTLRFLKALLALQTGRHQDTLLAIGQFRAIASTARNHEDAAVAATAATMEALTHVLRMNSADSIENAQTALATARGLQHEVSTHGLQQVTFIVLLVDICCNLYRNETKTTLEILKEFTALTDRLHEPDLWAPDGLFHVPLSPASSVGLPHIASNSGAICKDRTHLTCLRLSWLPKHVMSALAYMITAAVKLYENPVDHQAETCLKEAASWLEPSQGSLNVSDNASSGHHVLRCHIQIYLLFALCGRSAWGSARKELKMLQDMLEGVPENYMRNLLLYARYIEGAIAQGSGDTAIALSICTAPEFALDLPHKTPLKPPEIDLSILAGLNTLMIIHNPDHPQHSLLPHLLSSLETAVVHSQSRNVRAALRFVRAVTLNSQAEPGSVVKTKENLAGVIRDAARTVNSQLLCLTLNFMVQKYFRGVVGKQSLQSAQSGVRQARKTQNDLWTSVSYGLMADAYETQGQNEDALKTRRDAVQIAGRLPAAMQQEQDQET